ncbi:Hsp20/alpha crystallin family protein [Propylenella binzhouense]|uniref:Hsp20/alpha crystallin family protein n=1 Tax=Propylenella binzhouense TaxID=2555902 RepID=A0A964T7R6_9HYPH|nr:Hsp20/alpha crystallin family protein [Propylenella binzhouense]MYZ50101.1 Hsp20/alpha crystallin family protein [Propylenella binzhouense]
MSEVQPAPAETKSAAPAAAQAPAAAEPASADPFLALRRQMDRLFDDFQTSWPFVGRSLWESEFARPVRDWVGGNWGAVEAAEADGAYRISVELPGCEEKDIDVGYSDGMITIKAEKRQDSNEEKEDVHVSERRYGSFRRSFHVPEGVDADRIDATFKNGVLTLTVPKTEAARQAVKKIAVTRV